MITWQIQPEYSRRADYIALAKAEGLAFEALELSMPGANDIAATTEWYKKSGLTRSYHGAFVDMNPVSNDDYIREASQKRFAESCMKAIEVGAENIVFHSSCFPFLRGSYIEKWADDSAAYFIALSERFGLNVFVENSFDVDTTPLKMLTERACGKIKACLDIGHANLSRDPLEKWFDDLGDNVGYLHISDNMGYFDEHMALGDGTVDIKKASDMCAYLGNVTATFEVGGIDNIKRSVNYLKENHFFGM